MLIIVEAQHKEDKMTVYILREIEDETMVTVYPSHEVADTVEGYLNAAEAYVPAHETREISAEELAELQVDEAPVAMGEGDWAQVKALIAQAQGAEDDGMLGANILDALQNAILYVEEA